MTVKGPELGCLLSLLMAAGCSMTEATRHPRPVLPVPAHVAARYALPGEVRELSLVPIGGEDGLEFYRGVVACGDLRAEFHMIWPGDPGPHPFLLCLPILAGGESLMWIVAADLASRGYAAAWTKRVASAMVDNQDGHDLETLFRRTVVDNRMVLAWARQQPEIDPNRTGLVGISTGGIISGALLAVEPELRAGAVCLAGGDLPDLIMHSDEERVVSWRASRRREGLSDSEIERDLANHLVSDPALLAGYVDTGRVLLVAASLDAVVPRRNRDILWESFGRPRRLTLPLSHYSAALLLGTILGTVDEFMQDRFAQGGVATTATSPEFSGQPGVIPE